MTDVKRVTKTDALVAHIKGLGSDKFFTAIGIRTTALAEATGVPKNSIQALLEGRIKSGELVVCKISGASGQQEREYRAGPGVAPPEFKPLNTRRAHIAHGGATKPLPVATPAPSVSTPKPAAAAIVTPTFITKTQPEVVSQQKTPAADARPPLRADPAVAAAPATPKPKAGTVLKKEPATLKASAGDDLRIGINAEGTLVIALDDDQLELNVYQALKLGDFMRATQGVWRP